MQSLCRPSTETHSNGRLNTITKCDNNIKVVKSNFMRLRFTFYCAMLSGCSEFPNNHFFIQFSIFKNAFDVFAYVRFARLIYLYKLRLCQPHILISKAHIHAHFATFILI